MKRQNILILAMFFLNASHLFSQIVINEVLAGNDLAYDDPTLPWEQYPDWIELKNIGPSAVDVSGYFLSDNVSVPNKWAIPSGTIIPANGYLMIYADDINTGLHTNFKLSSSKEELVLSDLTLLRVDSVGYINLQNNNSYGKINATDNSFMSMPTPNGANNVSSAFEYSNSTLSIDVPTGIYISAQNVSITKSGAGDIYYTLDGTIPTSSSNLYTSPIAINSNTVLKAIVVENPTKYSIAENRSYVFNTSHDLPVVMLTADALYLNHNNDERIEGRTEFIFIETDKTTVINQYANFRQSGKSSRTGYPQLNGKIEADDLYGDDDFDHKMYPNKTMDKFNSFLLRNASQDWANTHLRDAFVSRLISQDNLTNTPFEAYRPAVLYVNAQYRGIINIREDDDSDYVKHNFKLKDNEFEKAAYLSSPSFIRVLRGEFVNFSSLDFNSASDRSTFEQLIDFHEHIALRLVFSYATPAEWGWAAWEDLSGKTGARFHYNFHDFDPIYGLAFDGANFTNIKNTPMRVNSLMEEQIKNYVPYRNEAAQYICASINHIYNTNRSMTVLDDMVSELQSEIPDHATAMNLLADNTIFPMSANSRPFSSLTQWQNNINDLRTNITNIMDDSLFIRISDEYNLGDTLLVKYESSDINMGFIRVHDVKSIEEEFRGVYFKDIPIRFSAEALPGYRFVDWDGDVNSNDLEITPTFNKSSSIRANFEPIPTGSTALVINEVQTKNDTTIADDNGEFDDWIEIHNPTATAIDLAGYYISDKSDNPLKWKIADSDPSKTTVPANGFLLLWADSDTAQGENHLNFKLSETEKVRFTSPDASTLVQELSLIPVATDKSYGAQVDADPNYIIFDKPTPDSTNNIAVNILEVKGLNKVLVYPNPTKNSVTISNLPNNIQTLNWKLYNVSGQLMKSGTNPEVDLELLDNGFYTLQILDVGFVKVLKL